jgi:hypothetical protein
MRSILILGLLFFTLTGSTTAQWIQSFENLGMYKVTITGITSDEQALYTSRLITECTNVLIARISETGDGTIFTEGEISFNEILQKLSVIPGIEIGERYQVKPSPEDYMETYNNYRRYPVDLSKTLPPQVIILDKEKQSRAHSVMKALWMQKYPDLYQQALSPSNDEDNPEKAEKEKMRLNQQNN